MLRRADGDCTTGQVKRCLTPLTATKCRLVGRLHTQPAVTLQLPLRETRASGGVAIVRSSPPSIGSIGQARSRLEHEIILRFPGRVNHQEVRDLLRECHRPSLPGPWCSPANLARARTGPREPGTKPLAGKFGMGQSWLRLPASGVGAGRVRR